MQEHLSDLLNEYRYKHSNESNIAATVFEVFDQLSPAARPLVYSRFQLNNFTNNILLQTFITFSNALLAEATFLCTKSCELVEHFQDMWIQILCKK
jgi:hypothetical protein